MQFEYFRAFYKGTAANSAATPFLLDLIIDEALGLTEHTCYFIPGKVKTSQVRGLSYMVTAELEAKPKTYADGYYDAIVWIYEAYGESAPAVFGGILYEMAHLPNVDLPLLEAFVDG